MQAEVRAAARGRGENAEAYRLYLQARFHNDRFTPADFATAVEAYRAALKLDPKYALAWAGLSIAYADGTGQRWFKIALDEGFGLAREAAEKALQLAPDLAEAHEAVGVIQCGYDLDWKGAEVSFARALELAPDNVHVLCNAMFLLHAQGRFDEAITLLRRAAELDPLSGRVYRELASCYLVAGRLDEALNAANREIHDVFRLLMLANIYHAQGRHADSDAAIKELIETAPDTAAYQIAEAFAFRDDRDQAFAWLERAYAQRDGGMSMVRSSPSMRRLHGDPRWQPFLEKVGLAG